MEKKEPYLTDHYERCYVDHSEALKKFIHGYVRNDYITEELTHEVFLKLMERGTPLDPENGTTRGFLFIAARHRCLDYLRKRATEEKSYRKMVVQEVMIDDQFYRDVEQAYIEGEVISTLYDVINGLPEQKREIFVKKALLNKRITEIMRELNVSSFMVRKTLREVLLDIRLKLGPYFEDEFR